MNKLIFTKYSNERANRFSIRTDIWQDERGERWVEKHPMHPEAIEHIRNIAGAYARLTGLFQNTGLQINHCVYEQAAGTLRLQYLEGKTLEEELDELLEGRKVSEVEERIGQYVSALRQAAKTVPFALTEGFQEVFGEQQGLDGMESYPVSNIDMIFSNVITSTQGDTLIDYEWTFSFAVPVAYIIYRCLFYYIRGNAKRLQLEECGLYERFGIREEQKRTFAAMEKAFQRYMLGERTPVRLLYDEISPGYTDMKPILRAVFQENIQRRVQVFYDLGNGFQEKESRWYPAQNGTVDLLLPIPQGVRRMRVDPCSAACVLWMKRSSVNGSDLTYKANGTLTGEDVFFFETEDPQLIFDHIPGNAVQMEIAFQVAFLDGIALEAVRSVNNQLENSQELVRQMEGTRAWKINEKFRKLFGRR